MLVAGVVVVLSHLIMVMVPATVQTVATARLGIVDVVLVLEELASSYCSWAWRWIVMLQSKLWPR